MMTIYAAVDGGEGEPLLELISQPKKLATFAKVLNYRLTICECFFVC